MEGKRRRGSSKVAHQTGYKFCDNGVRICFSFECKLTPDQGWRFCNRKSHHPVRLQRSPSPARSPQHRLRHQSAPASSSGHHLNQPDHSRDPDSRGHPDTGRFRNGALATSGSESYSGETSSSDLEDDQDFPRAAGSSVSRSNSGAPSSITTLTEQADRSSRNTRRLLRSAQKTSREAQRLLARAETVAHETDNLLERTEHAIRRGDSVRSPMSDRRASNRNPDHQRDVNNDSTVAQYGKTNTSDTGSSRHTVKIGDYHKSSRGMTLGVNGRTSAIRSSTHGMQTSDTGSSSSASPVRVTARPSSTKLFHMSFSKRENGVEKARTTSNVINRSIERQSDLSMKPRSNQLTDRKSVKLDKSSKNKSDHSPDRRSDHSTEGKSDHSSDVISGHLPVRKYDQSTKRASVSSMKRTSTRHESVQSPKPESYHSMNSAYDGATRHESVFSTKLESDHPAKSDSAGSMQHGSDRFTARKHNHSTKDTSDHSPESEYDYSRKREPNPTTRNQSNHSKHDSISPLKREPDRSIERRSDSSNEMESYYSMKRANSTAIDESPDHWSRKNLRHVPSNEKKTSVGRKYSYDFGVKLRPIPPIISKQDNDEKRGRHDWKIKLRRVERKYGDKEDGLAAERRNSLVNRRVKLQDPIALVGPKRYRADGHSGRSTLDNSLSRLGPLVGTESAKSSAGAAEKNKSSDKNVRSVSPRSASQDTQATTRHGASSASAKSLSDTSVGKAQSITHLNKSVAPASHIWHQLSSGKWTDRPSLKPVPQEEEQVSQSSVDLRPAHSSETESESDSGRRRHQPVKVMARKPDVVTHEPMMFQAPGRGDLTPLPPDVIPPQSQEPALVSPPQTPEVQRKDSVTAGEWADASDDDGKDSEPHLSEMIKNVLHQISTLIGLGSSSAEHPTEHSEDDDDPPWPKPFQPITESIGNSGGARETLDGLTDDVPSAKAPPHRMRNVVEQVRKLFSFKMPRRRKSWEHSFLAEEEKDSAHNSQVDSYTSSDLEDTQDTDCESSSSVIDVDDDERWDMSDRDSDTPSSLDGE